MSRSYLAALAAVAVAILAVGLVVRRSLTHVDRMPAAAPPSEAAALQQLSREGDLRAIAEFVDERVRSSASRVVFAPETQTAGIRWTADTVLATRDEQPIVALRLPAGDSVRPSLARSADDSTDRAMALRMRHRWVIAIGRHASGGVVSTASLAGGLTSAPCGDRAVEAFVLGTALDDQFAGAGLFALDGRLVGMAVRCAGRVVGVPTAEVVRLLADALSTAQRVRRDFGFAATPLDGRGQALFGVNAGLLVTEADPSRLAATLRVGDVLLAVDSAPVATAEDLTRVAVAAESVTVTRRRGATVSTVRLGRRAAAAEDVADPLTALGLQLARATDAATIEAVRLASPAALGGLRPGDRIVRVDGEAVRSAADVRRRLAASRAGNAFVVVARGAIERGVLVPLGSSPADR